MSLLAHTIKGCRILRTNTTYTLKHSCDTHYLSENLKSERIYTLECRESSLYIKDKESNKDIAIMLTKEIPNIQEGQILLDSKDLQALQTTLGLHTHKEMRAVYVEVEKPYYIDSEGYLQGLSIIKAPRPKLTEKTGKFQTDPIAIVLHRTESSTAASTLETWKTRPYGTHFLIDTDGTIYQCASLYKYTQHVGDIKAKNLELNGKNSTDYKIYTGKTYQKVSDIEKTKSYPNRYPINSDSIGIEVVAQCFNTMEKKVKVGLNYTQYNGKWQETQKEQKDSITTLINALKMIYNISNNDIYGHGEISAHKTANEGDDLYDK